jgi:hypothetical protein
MARNPAHGPACRPRVVEGSCSPLQSTLRCALKTHADDGLGCLKTGGIMPVLNPLHEKVDYEVQFNAGAGDNPGDQYVVLTGWVPKKGATGLPPDTDDEVGPGEFCRESNTAPAFTKAWRLRITIQVPHPSGSGTLMVTQGESHQTVSVTDDTTFLVPLIP